MNRRGSFILGLLASSVLFLSGCLKTRSDVAETDQRQTLQQQVVTLQRGNADSSARFDDVNEEMRNLRGRVEVVENKLNVTSNEADRSRKQLADQSTESGRRVALLQESLGKMDAQIQALAAEINALKAEQAAMNARQGAAAAAASQARKDPFDAGMEHFNQKDWKKAILSLQKYRDDNPKGSKLAVATYHIGVSFQELEMKDEARTFFEEVVAKFPNSAEAKKARTRLKSLKK